jgi:hypothetical protein
MGFNQRQAAGKFTATKRRASSISSSKPRTTPVVRLTSAERAVRALSDKELLAEVDRRGLNGPQR